MSRTTQAETDFNAGHFYDLDGVRGILAIVVMLYHYGLDTFIGSILGINDAVWDICVDFFFVLSGLVIARSVVKPAIHLWPFVLRRFWRLFPLHLMICLLFSPVLFLTPVQIGPVDLALDLTALTTFALQNPRNFPAWSLGFEFYGPMLFVGLLSWKMPGRRVSTALAVLCVIVLLPTLHQTLTRQRDNFGRFLDYVRAFSGLGLGFSLWLALRDCRIALSAKISRQAFPLTILLFFAITLISTEIPTVAYAMPAIFVAAMITGMGSRTFFAWGLFRSAGRLSFGIYMVHVPILYTFLTLLGPDRLDGSMIFKGIMILTSILAAWILHYIAERPGLRIMQRFGC